MLKAGIERGDIITYVDEEPTTGKDYEYILEGVLHGPA
jgi:C-terminal processing protease CtpA/Prc